MNISITADHIGCSLARLIVRHLTKFYNVISHVINYDTKAAISVICLKTDNIALNKAINIIENILLINFDGVHNQLRISNFSQIEKNNQPNG